MLALLGTTAVLSLILSFWSILWLIPGLTLVATAVVLIVRAVRRSEDVGTTLGAEMLATLPPGGSPTERKRLVTVLDRLAATFGVTGVSAFIFTDEGYNAAIATNGPSISLFVSSAVLRDFELIELEGVVAHLLARHRLGTLHRLGAAATIKGNNEQRRALAGAGAAYRADEVAAAMIRYPLGIASALRRCARQVTPMDSFFRSSSYDQWRYSFFNVASDRTEVVLGDLDDVGLRAAALEEW